MVEVVQRRAHCIYCPKGKVGDFAIDAKYGTSGLHRHINENCRYFARSADKSQKDISGDKTKLNKLTTVAHNQVDYLEACVEMIVIDELPF